MSSTLTFLFGLILLVLFGWHFATDVPLRKRILGLALTLLLVGFCIDSFWPPQKMIRLGLDLRGGTSFLIRLEPVSSEGITSSMLDQAMEVIRKRVDRFGVAEPSIAAVGNDRIRVEIPGLDADELKNTREQLQRVAKLEFALVYPGSQALIPQIEAGEAILPPGYVIKSYRETVEGKEVTLSLLVKRKPDMTGDHVVKAYPFYDQRGYGVSLALDSEGKKIFGDLTTAHRGEQLAILLDGEVQSAPNINEPILTGQAVITGDYTDAAAAELASVLENPLRTPVQIEEVRSVSASLGSDSIRSGVYAGLAGLALVLIAVLVYYRLAGFVAFVGLLINVIILVGLLAIFQFTLTLPGIAGVILTIGMAVDANVLIYERLREEMAAGKSLPAALEGAYEKAFSAIFDANATTLITALILFWQATGAVQGFAVTLSLGIVASMFSALLFTRTAFSWMTANFGLKRLTMLDLIPKHHFNFLSKGRIAFILSAILLIGSIAVFASRGKANFGIDFRGGDLLTIEPSSPVEIGKAREALQAAGIDDATLQRETAAGKELLSIRTPVDRGTTAAEALMSAFPDKQMKVVSEEKVGGQIGEEFARKALIALGLGLVGILLYVTFRFEFSFALGAVVALIHDVVITLGVFSISGRELSLVMVGAILTIAGYSINDTIVVFDRIREALKSGRRGSIQDLMNTAINETLGRTILTGGSTLLAIMALFFFGGAVLSDFAFAILIGIIVGTYSSIFVAAPIVLWWSRLTKKSIRREVLDSEAASAA